MQHFNSYWKQLTRKEIAAGKHREFIGGLWEDLGQLQFEFMKSAGLLPEHKLLDVGCGALRGGVHFIRYLDAGHYYGVDMNASLIEAGKQELHMAGLENRSPHLLVNDKFQASIFGTEFEFALALSLFTHLYTNHIIRCLVETRQVLQAGGRFYATFFEAPTGAHLEPITHQPGDIITNYDSDPFHYSLDEIRAMAEIARMNVEYIGDWGHPRNQKMLCFAPAT